MKRRSFFRQLFGAIGAAAAGHEAAEATKKRLVIQSSPIAGFQFHRGEAIWSNLRVGAKLTLSREPDNPHDQHAVAVYFHDEKLGYIPAGENAALAQMLDRGEELNTKISKLTESENPWKRVQVTISVA